MTRHDTPLYRLELKIPTASQTYQGRAVIQATLDAIDAADWDRVDSTTAERWGGHADERVSTKFFEQLARLGSPRLERLMDRALTPVIGTLAIRARTDAVQEHAIWTPLLDRIAILPMGRAAIPDYRDRLTAIHEWCRSHGNSDAVVPILQFHCEEVVALAIRNIRGLTHGAVAEIGRVPANVLRLAKENLYLRPEDGRILWEWIDRSLAPGVSHHVLRALEELVARRLVPATAVRRAIFQLWRDGGEEVTKALLPITLLEQWEWAADERQLMADHIIHLGDAAVAATAIEGGLITDPDMVAELGRAFPGPLVSDLLAARPEFADRLEAVDAPSSTSEASS